ncbi:MAG TPA: hypothetical protein VH969_31480 [Actinophytocola sp.]|jgi:hypothetical protein|uniref:hypothetical protein n=1 Tax=Actinophytocola sp. TaxID=1872138 RepID=UPI002F94AF4F
MGQSTGHAVRELTSPAAKRLAELAAVFDDLQFVLGCGERLLRELARAEQQDPVLIEALWAAALNAYARCFRGREHDAGLTVDDLAGTGLQGDVVQWHEMLGKLRNFLVAKAGNPREAFSVGVSLAADGPAEGIVVTSIPHPQVDEATVRQTGRIAYELGRLVDQRIQDQQRAVFAEVEDLPAQRLSQLPPLAVDMSVATAAEGS